MPERVLVVGGGGREHAITAALADGITQTDDDHTLVACADNRNPGIARLADEVQTLDERDPDAVAAFAEEVDATMAVIGPDGALAAGVADALTDAGVYAFGPSQSAARIEWDKRYQREFLTDNGIPGNPDYEVFTDLDAACEYAREGELTVLKPAGLTGGKGVRLIGDQVTREEAVEYLREQAYDTVLFEERLEGVEVTLQAIVANGSVRFTPAVHDHGRAFEGDEGPNTGGMGSVSAASRTLPFMTDAEYDAAADIVRQTVEAMDDYTGVLYGQFMLTADGPKIVEYNARFGDPEATNTLPTLETNFFEVVRAAKRGESLPALSFASRATVCKYAAPDGYPVDPVGGTVVSPRESSEDCRTFYASVDETDEGIRTTTSRSFAYVGLAESIGAAEQIVSDALAETDLTGLRVRSDIGTDELMAERQATMDRVRGERDTASGGAHDTAGGGEDDAHSAGGG